MNATIFDKVARELACKIAYAGMWWSSAVWLSLAALTVSLIGVAVGIWAWVASAEYPTFGSLIGSSEESWPRLLNTRRHLLPMTMTLMALFVGLVFFPRSAYRVVDGSNFFVKPRGPFRLKDLLSFVSQRRPFRLKDLSSRQADHVFVATDLNQVRAVLLLHEKQRPRLFGSLRHGRRT